MCPQTLGWAGYVKVDNTSYTFLGVPSVSGYSPANAVQKSVTVSGRAVLVYRRC
jgi:hypothetical protein